MSEMYRLPDPFILLPEGTPIRVGDIVTRNAPTFGCPLTSKTLPVVVNKKWFRDKSRIDAGNFFSVYRFNPYPGSGYRPITHYEHPSRGDIVASVSTVYGARIECKVSWLDVPKDALQLHQGLLSKHEGRIFDNPFEKHIPMLFWRKIEAPFGWYLVRELGTVVSSDDQVLIEGVNHRGVDVFPAPGALVKGERWGEIRSRLADRCYGIFRKVDTESALNRNEDGTLRRWKFLSVGDELNTSTDQVARVSDHGDVSRWDPVDGIGQISGAQWMYRRPIGV